VSDLRSASSHSHTRPSLDIAALADLSGLPHYLCKCSAILTDHDSACPVCGAPVSSAKNIKCDLEHAHQLGAAAARITEPERSHVNALGDLLSLAESFIHFATYSFDVRMLWLLAGFSRRVPVCGIISSQSYKEPIEKDLLHLENEHPNIRIRRSENVHTKLQCVDGLVEVGGSANVSIVVWRGKVANDDEKLEVHTNVDGVIANNNRYFARKWLALSGTKQQAEIRQIRPKP
jgi:hypothetical protein